MTTNTRIDLKVPYAEKDQAKVHGARWDPENQTWYAPPGTDLENLKRWLPKGVLTETSDPEPTSPKKAEKGYRPTRTARASEGRHRRRLPQRRLGPCRDQRATWQERTPVSHPDRAE